MTRLIPFSKMHGAGNDYIYVDTTRSAIEKPEQIAIRWSKPHTGIGSDGLVLICPSDKADFGMRIFNADGSEARMCGNASRCIGKFVYDKGLTNKKEITLDTLSGIKKLRLHVNDTNKVDTVTVNMGKPKIIETNLSIETAYGPFTGTSLSMGNPHFVILVDDVSTIDLPSIGPAIEHHPAFPDRVNVEFVQILSPTEIRMRVWERGSGITQACGTGACATAVASILHGKAEPKTRVIMDGGPLTIEWEGESVLMTGEAVNVFEGTIEI